MVTLIDENGATRVRDAKIVDLEKSMDQNRVNIVKWHARYLTGLYASERGSGYGCNTDYYGIRDWELGGGA